MSDDSRERAGRWARAILGAAAALSCAGAAVAQCAYEVTVIGGDQPDVPQCGLAGPPVVSGLGLNDLGHVVGRWICPQMAFDRAFICRPGTGFEDLGLPRGAVGAVAGDINDDGVICGTLRINQGFDFRGFVYDTKTDEWTILPPAVDGDGWSSCTAINNAGVVVGTRSINRDINPQNAFIWSAEDGFTDLGLMTGGRSRANDISEDGVVVGSTGPTDDSRGFIWEAGRLTILPPIPGGFTSSVGGATEAAWLSGSGIVEPEPGMLVFLGFVWEHGQFDVIDPLSGSDTSGAGDINIQRVVVGLSAIAGTSAGTSSFRAYVWVKGETYDLNELVTVAGVIRRAKDINNGGTIVADGVYTANNVVTFLLTPLNPPPGDLDGDCSVDGSDLELLLTHWGTPGPVADLNEDGIVDIRDLLLLLANWTL